MLYLQKVDSGEISWTYKNNLCLKVLFSAEDFPTIGIWWNNSAYPDEDGCRRNECAFEPIPGLTSDLSKEYMSGKCLTVGVGESFGWKIRWEIH